MGREQRLEKRTPMLILSMVMSWSCLEKLMHRAKCHKARQGDLAAFLGMTKLATAVLDQVRRSEPIYMYTRMIICINMYIYIYKVCMRKGNHASCVIVL